MRNVNNFVDDPLTISNHQFNSRLFLGTGKFGSYDLMKQAILASGSNLVTVALRRVDLKTSDDIFLRYLDINGVTLMPNTSGVRTAKEAIIYAELAREALKTNWIKLEIHPDPRYLLPDPIETYNAAVELVKRNFIVMPYVNADPVLCKRLEDIGVASVMPLASPIGSNRGLETRRMLEIIIEQSQIPVVVDAGLGAPSHAAAALELGAAAVLVNTAIAVAAEPIKMATAFKMAVEAGRLAYSSGIPATSTVSSPSSPLTSFLKICNE